MAETTVKAPQAGSGSGDLLLLVVAGVALVGGLVAFYLPASWPIYARWAALIVALGVSVGSFLLSALGRSLLEFVVVSRVELRKMVWPTMEETRKTTLLVIVFVIALGLFFWIIDWILGWGSRQLLGGGV